MSNETNNKIKQLFTKKTTWIAIVAAVVIIGIICAAIFLQPNNSKEDQKSTATQKPKVTEAVVQTITPAATQPVSSEAVSSEALQPTDIPATPAVPAATEPPAVTATRTPAEVFENDENASISAVSSARQQEFDDYVGTGDYSSAYSLLENYYKDSDYENQTLATFNNYVKYYETQQQYRESIAFQIDYIEQHDGLDNVRQESKHYQKLMETLKNAPDYTDARLDSIKASVDRWAELTALMENKDYNSVVQKTREYIKNGPDCVTSYYYLTAALNHLGEYFEESKVYYIYLSNHLDNSTLLTLEKSYVFLFTEHINSLFDSGMITSEQRLYLEEELDMNYLK